MVGSWRFPARRSAPGRRGRARRHGVVAKKENDMDDRRRQRQMKELRGLALAGVDKREIFITNVVHCHPHSEPRDNRASKPHEIANCTPYLVRELNIVEPELVISFGDDAKTVLRAEHPGARELSWPFRRPRSIAATPPDLLLVPHPSAPLRQRNAAPPGDRERIERKYVIDLTRALRWSFDAHQKLGRVGRRATKTIRPRSL